MSFDDDWSPDDAVVVIRRPKNDDEKYKGPIIAELGSRPPTLPPGKWTRDQALVRTMWRDADKVSRVGPDGDTTAKELLEARVARFKRWKKYNHPASRRAPGADLEPIFGSEDRFNRLIADGKLSPDQDGLFNEAEVIALEEDATSAAPSGGAQQRARRGPPPKKEALRKAVAEYGKAETVKKRNTDLGRCWTFVKQKLPNARRNKVFEEFIDQYGQKKVGRPPTPK